MTRVASQLFLAALMLTFGIVTAQDAGGAGTDSAPTVETYGLQEGKPFDGTTLRILSCCPTAPQLANMIERTNGEFRDLTGITVEWDNTPFGNFQEELLLQGSSGTGTYDLAFWVDSWGVGLENFIEPLDEYMAASGKTLDDYPQAFVDSSKMGTDTTYGFPLRGHAQLFYYRQDVFNDLGLEVPQTWQEIVEAGKVIRERTDLEPIAMYYGVNAGQNLFNWLSMLWGNGGDIFDENYRPVFNNEAGVAATEYYASLVQDQNVTDDAALAFNEQEANQEMVQGRAAMFVGWSWMYTRFTDAESAAPEVVENVAYTAAPGWEGGNQTSYGYLWPVGMFTSSSNKDAAYEYLQWLSSAELDRAVVLDDSSPEVNTVVAVHTSVLEDPQVNEQDNGLQQTMADTLSDARSQPLISNWLEVQSILEIAINEIAGGADAQSTLDDAASSVEEAMDRAGYYE